MKKIISIVTPVYNEEKNIQFYYDRITKTIDAIENYDFEIIFTDNCSSDSTFSLIKSLAENDVRIKAYKFSRNYGYQKSIFTGYSKSTGHCVIEFDCDLQDPPELLPRFIEEWEKGNSIVYGKRIKRPEGAIITKARKIFYRTLSAVSENELPIDAGDFMLLDRIVVNQLVSIKDHNIYIRGEVFSFGFKRSAIEYERDQRLHGDSKFPLRKLFSLAIDGFVSQSTLPLKLASYFGVTMAVTMTLLIVIYLLLHLMGFVSAAGFTTTTILILLSISVNAIFLGIIGEYLARLYSNTNNKPFVIIEDRVDNEAEQ
tara:strand:- start:617 stop:1558 length:942 start_codon:yes stop_codon:yes gene_type:complete